MMFKGASFGWFASRHGKLGTIASGGECVPDVRASLVAVLLLLSRELQEATVYDRGSLTRGMDAH